VKELLGNPLVALTLVLVLGTAAQWFAWRMKLPSILLLLIIGFLAGPLLNWIDPDVLLGNLLFPLVSLAVAMILFEGGLSLRWAELRDVGRVLVPMLTLGVLIVWVLATLGGLWILHMPVSIALLLGAILTVTGPTVIGPLLREIRPLGKVGPIAKWEGIVVDPIGASLAVLVFQAIEFGPNGTLGDTAWIASKSLILTVLVGSLIGGVAAWMLALAMRKFAIPDHLQTPVTLVVVLMAFTTSNILQHESGLLTVTLMGLILANQSLVSVKHIVEFKENLRVLLIAGLFILLSARLRWEQISAIGWREISFVLWLIVIVRPVSIWISTIGSGLTRRERIFLACFAPRGIVAASVSSIFALKLGESAFGLVESIFCVVVGTVTVYGLTSGWLARRLGLSSENPQGLLIVGAHQLAREIATAVQASGVPVLLVDSSRDNISAAHMAKLRARQMNVLSEGALEHLDFGGMGRMLALTSNDEVNTLATQTFAEVFGRSETYQLPPKGEEKEKTKTAAHLRRGRLLFGTKMTYQELQRRFNEGARVKRTRLTEEFTLEDFAAQYGPEALTLFIASDDETLTVVATDTTEKPKPRQWLISLVQPIVEENAPAATESVESKS
jgi:NhaP-type Na+/H+ or K+/H+ antiporter